MSKSNTSSAGDSVEARNSASAVRVAGRVLLWACITVVLIRGLGAILAGPGAVTSSPAPATSAAAFPDDEAGAFAVRFARVYLTSVDDDRRRALRPYLADELRDSATVGVSRHGPGVRVAWATVAREASLGSSRALVTVAVLLTDNRSRYLTVPVGRDRRGGLAVFDLPAVSPPPPLGDVDGDARTPLSGSDGAALADVVGRFLRSYLGGGDPPELAYYVVPGARVMQMPAGLKVTARC